jgi:hypothetical protein
VAAGMRILQRRGFVLMLSSFTSPHVVLLMLSATAVVAVGPRLTSTAEEGWRTFVHQVEQRRAREVTDPDRFLALDFLPTRAADRRALQAGAVVIRPVDTGGFELPDARVHHWRGAVLLPGATVARVLTVLEQGPPPQADVLRASVLSRSPAEMRVHLRVRRRQVVTVVYDTEHVVHFGHHGTGRASSSTVATHIVEIDRAGTPDERPLAAGDDRGFLWRLNGYWRYEQVAGGVIAECESISLSRDVPFGLGVVAAPFISRAAHESMESALLALRALPLGLAPPRRTGRRGVDDEGGHRH